MAVITQKSCVALFPLWSLKKTFLERGGGVNNNNNNKNNNDSNKSTNNSSNI